VTAGQWVAVIAGLGAVACGDNTAREAPITAISGTRLAVQWYGYSDGTRQSEADEFYDKGLHARCVPGRWTDDTIRCVPDAGDVVFLDAGCANGVGRAGALDEPTHFIDYQWLDGERRPTRLYSAGAEIASVTQYYQRFDGACAGPFTPASDLLHYMLADEIAGDNLVPLRDVEIGSGRLGLIIREGDDGLRVPHGVRDHELGIGCTPTPISDGSATCAPTDVVIADHFADPACQQPVVLVAPTAPVPDVAQVVEASGCSSYHRVGVELSTRVYRRAGDACVATVGSPTGRGFAVGSEIDLPMIARTVEAAPAHRLQRVVLDDGEVRFFDDALLDTATRSPCRRHRFDDVTRCIPSQLAPAITLFTYPCVVPVPVVELANRLCDRPAFAAAGSDGGLEIYAIGAPVSQPLYHWDAVGCSAYLVAPGSVLHTLGPAIDPTAFPGAVYFGER
jgi:hypothetical protein